MTKKKKKKEEIPNLQEGGSLLGRSGGETTSESIDPEVRANYSKTQGDYEDTEEDGDDWKNGEYFDDKEFD